MLVSTRRHCLRTVCTVLMIRTGDCPDIHYLHEISNSKFVWPMARQMLVLIRKCLVTGCYYKPSVGTVDSGEQSSLQVTVPNGFKFDTKLTTTNGKGWHTKFKDFAMTRDVLPRACVICKHAYSSNDRLICMSI